MIDKMTAEMVQMKKQLSVENLPELVHPLNLPVTMVGVCLVPGCVMEMMTVEITLMRLVSNAMPRLVAMTSLLVTIRTVFHHGGSVMVTQTVPIVLMRKDV